MQHAQLIQSQLEFEVQAFHYPVVYMLTTIDLYVGARWSRDNKLCVYELYLAQPYEVRNEEVLRCYHDWSRSDRADPEIRAR